jgi:hypothetical protein
VKHVIAVLIGISKAWRCYFKPPPETGEEDILDYLDQEDMKEWLAQILTWFTHSLHLNAVPWLWIYGFKFLIIEMQSAPGELLGPALLTLLLDAWLCTVIIRVAHARDRRVQLFALHFYWLLSPLFGITDLVDRDLSELLDQRYLQLAILRGLVPWKLSKWQQFAVIAVQIASRSRSRLLYRNRLTRTLLHGWREFNAFTGFEFDASLGYPGEGPLEDDRKDMSDVEDSGDDGDQEMEDKEDEFPEERVGDLILRGKLQSLVCRQSEVHVSAGPEFKITEILGAFPPTKERGKPKRLGWMYRCRVEGHTKKTILFWWSELSPETRELYKKNNDKNKARYELEEAWRQGYELQISEEEIRARIGDDPKSKRKKKGKSSSSRKRFTKYPCHRREKDSGARSATKTEKNEEKKRHEPKTTQEEIAAQKGQAEQFLRDVERSFQAEEKEHETDRTQFPRPPSWEEIKNAVNSFREMLSEPAVTRCVCTVCGETNWRRDVRWFIENNSGSLSSSQSQLTPEFKQQMQRLLPRAAQQEEEKGLPRKLEWLNNLCFERAGISEDDSSFAVCNACLEHLRKGDRPPCALANGLFFGKIPDELKDLTWAEQRVIALHRAALFVLHLRGKDSVNRKTNSRIFKMKGHAACLPQKVTHVLKVLPPRASELDEMVKAIFVNGDGKLPAKVKLHHILAVRRTKVEAALKWLIKHNPLYANVQISKENLDTYPDDTKIPEFECIPTEVWSSMLCSDDAKESKKEGSSYTHEDSDSSDSDEEESPFRAENLEKTGLCDSNAAEVNVADVASFAKQKILKIPAGAPIQEQSDEALLMGSFPEIFPFGVGGPNCSRRKRLPLEEYARHVTRLHDARFRQHSVALFVLFNILQRQRIRRSTYQSLSSREFVDFDQHLNKLTPEEIAKCIKDLEHLEHTGKLPKIADIREKAARNAFFQLFRKIGRVGGRLPLTDSSKRKARMEIMALMTR